MQTENFSNNEPGYLMQSAPGAVAVINGKECFYFGGTSYYGLQSNKEIIDSAAAALDKYGISSSSTRASYGNTQLLNDVEIEAAKFFGCEDAAYLPSGFLTDMAAVEVFKNLKLFDSIFIDESSHYSNNYAARLAGLPIHEFKHLDHDNLKNQIKSHLRKGGKPLVISDGVFPVFGKIAPADKYLEIVKEYDGILWLDDAHGMGVIGENGRGTYEHYKLKSEIIFFGGTLSKAFGGFGGIIPGSKNFIDHIKSGYFSKGTTPVPSPAAAASLTGLKMVRENTDMRLKLWENARRLKSGLKSIGIEVENSDVPVAAWEMKSRKEMEMVRKELFSKNIVIQLMNYSGTGNDGVLRAVVFSTHTPEQIENLISELKKIL